MSYKSLHVNINKKEDDHMQKDIFPYLYRAGSVRRDIG